MYELNTKKSFVEVVVTQPTTDFTIGFEFDEGVDVYHVLVDGVPAKEAGYTTKLKNSAIVELTPAVPNGTVRIYRETDIDSNLYKFTAGALFEAHTMDANFNQILHSQQETRDGFDKLAGDVYPLVGGLEVALEKAGEASKAAQEAADAAVEAAQTTRSASQVTDDSGQNQQQINNTLKRNVRSYGAKGLFNVTTRTGTAETTAFKNYVADQQANAWGSIDLAADIYDYLIDETLVFDKTVTIFGGSGSTYNQPEQPKKGSVVLANGLALGFDLGASRPAPPLNFADMWCVKDLMVQPQTMKSKTQTAFAITGANDAPDRGINFVGVSAMGFDKCVYLPDKGTLTQGATMNFDGCVMSHNANVIVADNCVYGLRVVNSQMEANTASVIKGKFNAAVTIEDNMLEGNVNCIDLKSGTRVAFQSQVTIGSNYFEWNKGDFVARIQGVAAWDDLYPTVTINPNFAYEIDAPDYMIFKDRLQVKYNDVTHYATMANGFDGVYGSYLTNSHKNKIKARKGSDGKFSSSIAQNPSDISSLREPTGFSTVTVERTDKAYINLNGKNYTYLNEYDEFHPVSGTFNAGDVVEIHAIFCDVGRMRGNGTEEIRTHFGFGGYFNGGAKAFEVNSVGVTKSNGDVAVVSGICTVETTITNPIFRWYCLENDNLSGKFLGFAYKNHGQVSANSLLITPFVPTLTPYNPNRYKSVQVMTIPANSSSYVIASVPNAKYGDMVVTSITPVDNPSHVVSANGYVNDSNQVVIRVFNNYSVPITNAQFWINAEVKK